ncbi:hypothetical protein BDV18DRAFT_138146 [Aspergillus unguis]
MKNFLLATLLASATQIQAHIQMSKPYPIRSPLNQDASGQKDYSYTNPLSTSGSDYPCKGYADDPFNSVATYTPGSEYELELQGSAVHGGGSCQIALSYDKGESFHVIHSMLGGCPITKSYKFTVPADAPTGEALLSWSWFNKVGNREMYMNCAQVTIGSDSSARKAEFLQMSQAQAFSSLPPIFIANVNGPGQCTTIEGEEVNFPKPGPSVEGSLSGKGYKCEGSAPFLGSSNGPNVPSSGASSAAASSTTPAASSAAASPSSSAAASSSSVEVSKVASEFGEATATATMRPQLPVGAEEPCSPGTVICSDDGASWWLCDQGKPVHMGLVAPGTHCSHGAMQPAN